MALADQNDTEATADGDLLMWILIWGELVIFAALIGAFALQALKDPAGFEAGRALLASRMAGLNTVVLLLSGWFAALAVRAGNSRFFRRVHLIAAGGLGMVFAVLKIAEYRQEWPIASLPGAESFFQSYVILTGYHLAHVVFLAGLLLLLAFRQSSGDIRRVATLWHVTDLVWLALFPLIYLS
ncbi:cytochrome c oxidase subunit 3 [Gellertiella hungarica]|uniref:Nitric oxide reductase NorE protein n=1 Tax=Gellertiella hungarica TaxID=1572859 RepID=A0A7W6NLG6_9HYPH|nr:cytochrome c oxidase subunit 3 [Gellertiella hungarica]MBB4065395.1 nitric oxide reductase NorE protein [Gellertiella hungarica]